MIKEVIIWSPIVTSVFIMTLMCIHRTTNKLANILGASIFAIIAVILGAYNYYITYNSTGMYWVTHFSCLALFPTMNMYITVFTVKTIPKYKWLALIYAGLLVPIILAMHWIWHDLSWSVDVMVLWAAAAYFTTDSYKLLFFFRSRVNEHFSGKELNQEERLFTHMFLLPVMSAIALLFFALLHVNIHDFEYRSLGLYVLSTVMVGSIGYFVWTHHKNLEMYHNVVYKEAIKIENENRVGGVGLVPTPTSHTTTHAGRHVAVSYLRYTLT